MLIYRLVYCCQDHLNGVAGLRYLETTRCDGEFFSVLHQVVRSTPGCAESGNTRLIILVGKNAH